MFRIRTLMAFGAGLAAAYFMDPVHGRGRRQAAKAALDRHLGGQVSPAVERRAAGQSPLANAVGRVVEQPPAPSPSPGVPPPAVEG